MHYSTYLPSVAGSRLQSIHQMPFILAYNLDGIKYESAIVLRSIMARKPQEETDWDACVLSLAAPSAPPIGISESCTSPKTTPSLTSFCHIPCHSRHKSVFCSWAIQMKQLPRTHFPKQHVCRCAHKPKREKHSQGSTAERGQSQIITVFVSGLESLSPFSVSAWDVQSLPFDVLLLFLFNVRVHQGHLHGSGV